MQKFVLHFCFANLPPKLGLQFFVLYNFIGILINFQIFFFKKGKKKIIIVKNIRNSFLKKTVFKEIKLQG